MPNFKDYIGLPYKHKGRDFGGIDCWGLYRLIYEYELNIVLPDFTDVLYDRNWYKREENHILENISRTKFEKVEPPYKLYDGMIFYKDRHSIIANHIGMYIDDEKFIHVLENKLSMISRLDSYWNSLLYGVMRYNG
jgi:cell wall-associated NlpC family hydrolase